MERENDGRSERRERWGRVEGHEPQSKGSEVRQFPERDGHAEHRGILGVGFDHGAVHPRWVAPERHAGSPGGPHDHLPVAALDRLHWRPAGLRRAWGSRRGGSHDFFSFGTNDLTQMVCGMSRDDAEEKFLAEYLRSGLLLENPFET